MAAQKVGVGARAHETTISFMVRRSREGSFPAFRAKCSCGWRGEDHGSRALAEDDEFAHLSAEVG